MSPTYIAATTKSIITRLMVRSCSMFGFVINCFAPAIHWLKQKTSRYSILKVTWSRQTLPLNPAALNLMTEVAKAASIPAQKITGFKLSQGRWFICLKEIGWLRTSDLLQMQIKLFTPLEDTK